MFIGSFLRPFNFYYLIIVGKIGHYVKRMVETQRRNKPEDIQTTNRARRHVTADRRRRMFGK